MRGNRFMKRSAVYIFIALALLSLSLTLVPYVSSNYYSDQEQPIGQYIQVSNYSYFIGQGGVLFVVGQVQNTGPYTFQSVYLAGSVYSTDGEDQRDSFTQVYVLYMLPQQKAPFEMAFASPNNSTDGTWHSILANNLLQNVTLTPLQLTTTTGYEYPNLAITKSSSSIYPTTGGSDSEDYGGAYMVSGEIKNTGSQTATNLTVSGTFYNSAGLVVAVGFTTFLTPENLGPSNQPHSQFMHLT